MRLDRSKRANTNLIPIGIINADVLALNETQVDGSRSLYKKFRVVHTLSLLIIESVPIYSVLYREKWVAYGTTAIL